MEQEKNPPQKKSEDLSEGQKAYNIVSDTVVGVNVRKKDNLIQGIAVAVALVAGCVIGFLVKGSSGILIGALIGLIGGLIVSGAALAFYRMIRHMQGKHD